jgi:signal transduction histidine kinase
MLPMGRGGLLRVVAASGLAVEATSSHVRVGEPISGIVAQRKQPILMNQVTPQQSERATRYQTGSFISAPVSIQDDQIGVLNVADPQGGYFQTDDLAAIVTLASQIGRSVAWGLAREQIQQLELTNHRLRRQAFQAVEEDRQRIARDLHDEAGHSITAAIFRLDLALSRLPVDDAGSRAMIETVRSSLLDYASTLHTLAFGLRPRILQDLGLGAALRSLVHQVQDDGALNVVLQIVGEPVLTEELELLVFRVVQEALTNTRKHARASRLEITLRCVLGQLLLTIEDNGVGITRTIPARDVARPSLGLAGIQERVELFGGTFMIGPRATGGTRLAVCLPC